MSWIAANARTSSRMLIYLDWFNSIDTPGGTKNFDMIYIDDDLEGGNSLNVGLCIYTTNWTLQYYF